MTTRCGADPFGAAPTSIRQQGSDGGSGDTWSFGARAAARDSLVASAVSKRIAAIEREIGTPLLVRGRRGIEPTAAGEALLRQARDVLGAMERMRAEISEFATGVQGSVRVMASVSALAERLPDDIASFLARYKSVRVSLDEGVSS